MDLYRRACRVRGIKAGPKAVLVALADRHNDEKGYAWPSVDTLAEQCCMGTNTVRRAVRALEAAGLLVVVRSQGHAPNSYTIDGAALDAAAEAPTLPNLNGSNLEPFQSGTLPNPNPSNLEPCQIEAETLPNSKGNPAKLEAEPLENPKNPERIEGAQRKKRGRPPKPRAAEPDLPLAGLPAAPEPPKRGRRLPDDWQPEPLAEGSRAALVAIKWSADDWADEIEGFREYWHAEGGSRAVKLNWQSAWAKWVLKSKEIANRSRRGESGWALVADRIAERHASATH